MSLYIDYKTAFLDTYRHFHPVVDIPKKNPIVCGGLDLKKSNLKNVKTLGFAAYAILEPLVFEERRFGQIVRSVRKI